MDEETADDGTVRSIKSELWRLREKFEVRSLKFLRGKELQLDPGRPLSIRATLQSKRSIKRIELLTPGRKVPDNDKL